MFAIVCVYNDSMLFDVLERSLKRQNAAYQLIAINNCAGAYKSAAQALNHGSRQTQAGNTHLMFVHQDITLCADSWLETVEAMMHSLPDCGIAGVAGKADGSNTLLSNIVHGVQPRPAGVRIEKPTEVMTVDECLAIVPRCVFDKYQFDERVCGGWHCYMVEYCLRIRQEGLRAYVLPVEVYHRSTGTQDRAYFQSLRKVLAVHRKTYKKIYTTCGCWDTRMPVMIQRAWSEGKKYFYACTGRLIAWGLVPEWMQRKKRKRLQAAQQKLQP